MKSRHWLIAFFTIMAVGIFSYMGLNFYANPLGYFTNEKKLDYYYADDFGRSIKSKYLLEHKDEIDAVILGGSKAGRINTALLDECTGRHYYNLYINYGNFSDYLLYTRFIAEHTNVKEIMLHLSSYETVSYDRTDTGSAYAVPAVWSRNLWKETTEALGYLMPDLNATKTALTKRRNKPVKYADVLADGMKNQLQNIENFQKDPDTYVKKHVLSYYNKRLTRLFEKNENNTLQLEHRSKSLEALRQIKQICDQYGITLNVVIGAGFVSEHALYECSEYYDYLRQIVEICTQVWDFSDFNDVSLNPYNFSDGKHFTNAVADLMVNTIYGREQKEGFGILLTPDNIYDYLIARREKYLRLQKEFLQTGEITLYDMSHSSYIPLS